MNHIELPLARLCGHGDVKIYKKQEYLDMVKKAGFTAVTVNAEKKMRCHLNAEK